MSHIKVFVRVRPLTNKEIGQETIIQSDQKHVIIEQTTQISQTEFDQVFSPESLQIDVFRAVEGSIGQALKGFNSTILAYGQTGSGKTHTMFGSDWEYNLQSTNTVQMSHQATFIEEMHLDKNHAGIIPRTIYHLFAGIKEQYVYCSFLQIYNEKIYDLLQDHKQPLHLHESKTEGVYVESLTEYAVNNFHDCLTLMKRGERNRMIRQTYMNLKSSRSHTIFQLVIESSVAIDGQLKKAKINLCDLAGSEKINKEEVMSKDHMLELKSINQSLTTLGKVIQSLYVNGRKPQKIPIPYRESKITRLLQDSLGGNTLTNIIVNVAPNIYNIDETVSSIKFAQRARNIQLEVKANKINATDQVLVNKLMKEIDYLKSLLNMKRNGFSSNDIHYKLMKMQEENDRLRSTVVSVQQVEALIRENRNMKEELQKISQEGGSTHSFTNQIKQHSETESDQEHFTSHSHNTSKMMVISNPTLVSTEVNVRFKAKGNKLMTRRGYVEYSDEQIKKEKRLISERRRVVERLELLESLSKKNLNTSVPEKQQLYYSINKPPRPKILPKIVRSQEVSQDNLPVRIIERPLK